MLELWSPTFGPRSTKAVQGSLVLGLTSLVPEPKFIKAKVWVPGTHARVHRGQARDLDVRAWVRRGRGAIPDDRTLVH